MSAKGNQNNAKTKGSDEVYFKCQVCGKPRKLEEMRLVNRFFPALVVCPDCSNKMT